MDERLSLEVKGRRVDLTGKVAVVTGASRGVGRGIAIGLGEAGATVYVTGRTVEPGTGVDNMPGTIYGASGGRPGGRPRREAKIRPGVGSG
jgi:NAD(P)-dependent dehydrogenase (short-subunit alcohol dehydrogenase family)